MAEKVIWSIKIHPNVLSPTHGAGYGYHGRLTEALDGAIVSGNFYWVLSNSRGSRIGARLDSPGAGMKECI